MSSQENGLPYSTAAMNSALSKLCSRNGLPHITVHGLRHPYVKLKTKIIAKQQLQACAFMLAIAVYTFVKKAVNKNNIKLL